LTWVTQYTDHEAAQKYRFSSKKKLKTHSTGHAKQYREAMKFVINSKNLTKAQ
jgi:hypothetical protein